MGDAQQQWQPQLNPSVDPSVQQAIKVSYRYLYQLRGMASGLQNAGYITGDQAEASYGAPAASQALSVSGKAPLNVQGLLGVLAQPQTAGAPSVTALPPAGSPQAQNGALVNYNGVLYWFNGATAPGSWESISAAAVILYGTRASMPASAASGALYYQTDTDWLYYGNGTSWAYAAGIGYGTDATRAAISVTTGDNGATWITSDTAAIWRVVSGAWAQVITAGVLATAHGEALSATASAVTLLAAAPAGIYRATASFSVNTLGTRTAASVQIVYTDLTGVAQQAYPANSVYNPALFLAGNTFSGATLMNVKAGTNITATFALGSGTGGSFDYVVVLEGMP